MIRLRVAALLRKKGWSAYRLGKEARLPLATAYRLADPDYRPGRLPVGTLERLADVFQVELGDLLERVAPKRRR